MSNVYLSWYNKRRLYLYIHDRLYHDIEKHVQFNTHTAVMKTLLFVHWSWSFVLNCHINKNMIWMMKSTDNPFSQESK